MKDYTKFVAFLETVSVITPKIASDNYESMRVCAVDTEFSGDIPGEVPYLYTVGEESGEEYSIPLDEFNYNDYFYYTLNEVSFDDLDN